MNLKLLFVLLIASVSVVGTSTVAMSPSQDEVPQRVKGGPPRDERRKEKKQLAIKPQETLNQVVLGQPHEEPTYHVPGPYYQPSIEEQLRRVEENGWREVCESGFSWLSKEGVEYCHKIGLEIQPNQWPHDKEGVWYLYKKDIRIPIEELPKQKAVTILRLFQEAGIAIPIDEWSQEKAFAVLRLCHEMGITIPIDKLPQEKAVKVFQLLQEFQEQQKRLRQQEMERKNLEHAKEQAHQEEMRKLLEIEKRKLREAKEKKLLGEKSLLAENNEVLEDNKRKQLEHKLQNINKVLAATTPMRKEATIKSTPHQVPQQKVEKNTPSLNITPLSNEKVIKPGGNPTFPQNNKEMFEQKLQNTNKVLAAIAPMPKEAAIKPIPNQASQQKIEKSKPYAPIALAIGINPRPFDDKIDEELQRRFEKLKAPQIAFPIHNTNTSRSDDGLSDLEHRLKELKASSIPSQEGRLLPEHNKKDNIVNLSY